jgi:outer membrane protein TolC
MCRFFKILTILLLSLLSVNLLQGQELLYGNSQELSAAISNFPPLQAVIDSVIKRSAMVNFRTNNIEAKEAALASERLHWTRNLGLQVDSRYGNLNNFTSNEDGEALSQVLTTTTQLNYSAGFFLKFPLFDGLNRKHQIKLAESEVEAAKSMVQFENEQLRKMVITLYQELLLKQKLLQIRSESLGDGRVNMQMVEKEFRNGLVPMSEYVRINSMTTNMEAAYETALSEFITTKKMLEDMAGFVFDLNAPN